MQFLQKQLSEGASFGRDLRELRELRGFTRDDVSRVTHIHVSVITALEEERLVELNDPLYAERHVRAIVLALEGRPAYYLKKYHDLLQATYPAQPEMMMVRPTVRRRDLFVTSRAVALAGFLFLCGCATLYLVWQGRILQESPKLDVQTPVEGMHAQSSGIFVRGETDPGAKVLVNGRDAVVDRTGHFELSMDIPRGVTIVTIEALRRYGARATVTRRVTYDRAGIPTEVDIDSFSFFPMSATGTSSTQESAVSSTSSVQ